MKKTLTLVLSSTALAAILGLPALGTTSAPNADLFAASGTADGLAPLIRVSGDDDDDDEGSSFWRWGHDDDDDDEDCDDDDDEDEGGQQGRAGDDGACLGAAGNPAPAGTATPPTNGLFGTGAPPVAVTR